MPAYAALATELGPAASEVHAGVERARLAQLVRKGEGGKPQVVREALRLFVQHGARYCFPAMRGEGTRGMPTAHAADPLVGRGQSDYLFSHDLGDVISVVDGHDSLVEECRAALPELRAYLGVQFGALLAHRPFRDALPSHLPGDMASQERLPELEVRLQELARLAI